MSRVSAADLRPVDLFDGVDDDALAAWADAARMRELPEGSILTEPGDTVRDMHFLLRGVMEALGVDGDRTEPLGDHVAPTWIGAIGALTGGPSVVRMRASTDVRVASIERERFVELVMAHRPVFDRIMAAVRPVTSRIAALEQNRERLAALGTMAAGLAHELNNPAAAAKRSSAALAEALEVLGGTIGRFVESGVERDAAEQLVGLQREAVARAAERGQVGALDAADAEDEITDALDDLGVAEGWRLAEPLAAAGVDEAWLLRVADLAGPATGAALEWVAASITASGLAAELTEATDRMSHLVGAVKSYAYMDRGEIVEVDVHEGIETTLTILNHKLKGRSIRVDRDFDRTLPKLMVRGAELNQVWTNLLDNAIDALGESGTITITTGRENNRARIEIADDGPGIPAHVLPSIFDPFFTTKDVGKGTGLGLDTARRIVVDRHRGGISAESVPGRTVIRVLLPLEDRPG